MCIKQIAEICFQTMMIAFPGCRTGCVPYCALIRSVFNSNFGWSFPMYPSSCFIEFSALFAGFVRTIFVSCDKFIWPLCT